jgi:LytS/YehU family sensor histidine kinase
MVQTLVENGIKHGISQLREGGLIQITTRVEDDRLRMVIRNSGAFKPGSPGTPGTGLGLDNTRQRLKLIYHDDASFRIITEKDNFVVTEVIVPHLYNI